MFFLERLRFHQAMCRKTCWTCWISLGCRKGNGQRDLRCALVFNLNRSQERPNIQEFWGASCHKNDIEGTIVSWCFMDHLPYMYLSSSLAYINLWLWKLILSHLADCFGGNQGHLEEVERSTESRWVRIFQLLAPHFWSWKATTEQPMWWKTCSQLSHHEQWRWLRKHYIPACGASVCCPIKNPDPETPTLTFWVWVQDPAQWHKNTETWWNLEHDRLRKFQDVSTCFNMFQGFNMFVV